MKEKTLTQIDQALADLLNQVEQVPETLRPYVLHYIERKCKGVRQGRTTAAVTVGGAA
jgi:hypothetical protein